MLKEDLHVMRAAIDSYTMDKQKAPQSLDDLIQDGYLRSIPEDPMTHSNDTWVTDTSDALSFGGSDRSGINDVHSGSDRNRVRRATVFRLVDKRMTCSERSIGHCCCW